MWLVGGAEEQVCALEKGGTRPQEALHVHSATTATPPPPRSHSAAGGRLQKNQEWRKQDVLSVRCDTHALAIGQKYFQKFYMYCFEMSEQ